MSSADAETDEAPDEFGYTPSKSIYTSICFHIVLTDVSNSRVCVCVPVCVIADSSPAPANLLIEMYIDLVAQRDVSVNLNDVPWTIDRSTV